MILNEMGEIVDQCWGEIPDHYPGIVLDEYIIMPNHIHGIIMIVRDNNFVGDRHAFALQQRRNNQLIPNIIGSYKSASSKLIHRTGNKLFKWQKSFHDRIVRNQDEYHRIQYYIKNNPALFEATVIDYFSLRTCKNNQF